MLLSLIYRDYICSLEVRKQLLEKDEEEIKKEEEILREKYSIDKILIGRNDYRTQEIQEEKTIIHYKENFIKRMINKIKSFFKR